MNKFFAPGLIRPVVFPYGVPGPLVGVPGPVVPVSVWSYAMHDGSRDFGAVWIYDFDVGGVIYSYPADVVASAELWGEYMDSIPSPAPGVRRKLD